MFRLYCDLCFTEISPLNKDPMVKLTIEEMKYMGSLKNGCNREFLTDHECVNHKAYLCPHCVERLKQFMNLEVSTGYTFKGE